MRPVRRSPRPLARTLGTPGNDPPHDHQDASAGSLGGPRRPRDRRPRPPSARPARSPWRGSRGGPRGLRDGPTTTLRRLRQNPSGGGPETGRPDPPNRPRDDPPHDPRDPSTGCRGRQRRPPERGPRDDPRHDHHNPSGPAPSAGRGDPRQAPPATPIRPPSTLSAASPRTARRASNHPSAMVETIVSEAPVDPRQLLCAHGRARDQVVETLIGHPREFRVSACVVAPEARRT
jgi:hypothetical protein